MRVDWRASRTRSGPSWSRRPCARNSSRSTAKSGRLRARLNGLLARDSTAALADPVALRPLPALTTADAQSLVDRARQRNPQIAAELARLTAAQKNRELTQANRYPDLQVGVSPSQMGSRITTWGVMFEINIPLQQESRRGQEREADAMVSAARVTRRRPVAPAAGRTRRQPRRA
jgi:outer membrane protein TolC